MAENTTCSKLKLQRDLITTMKLESMNEPIKEITHIERSFFYTRQIISNELQ